PAILLTTISKSTSLIVGWPRRSHTHTHTHTHTLTQHTYTLTHTHTHTHTHSHTHTHTLGSLRGQQTHFIFDCLTNLPCVCVCVFVRERHRPFSRDIYR